MHYLLLLPLLLAAALLALAAPRARRDGTATSTTAAVTFSGTIPYASLSTMTDPAWATVPYPALLTRTPFCTNAADPDAGVGNHCVCANGATLDPIPWTGGNMSTYQPCAYTTVNRPAGYGGGDGGGGYMVVEMAEERGERAGKGSEVVAEVTVTHWVAAGVNAQ
ncbi:hypothetical protein P8C59_001551 [Phyllachora maydis]|uniref:Uncharacterized protein n=1 Tax=Phyllachora maydis TaxID=1825666 RepID=A0AAD9MAD2_9PEZI|nr:hypothetical protein P8C59_001551 [Phyllachora maydis]